MRPSKVVFDVALSLEGQMLFRYSTKCCPFSVGESEKDFLAMLAVAKTPWKASYIGES